MLHFVFIMKHNQQFHPKTPNYVQFLNKYHSTYRTCNLYAMLARADLLLCNNKHFLCLQKL